MRFDPSIDAVRAQPAQVNAKHLKSKSLGPVWALTNVAIGTVAARRRLPLLAGRGLDSDIIRINRKYQLRDSMISGGASSKSGRFILRMPPALHAALHDAARASGLSLNAFCVRQLEAFGVGVASNEDATALVSRARAVVGEALSAVVLHGSWVRGEATAGSDVDALIVVNSRLKLSRELYRAWDAQPISWRGHRVDPHFVHLPPDGRFSGLWAEQAIDGIVLFENDWKVSAHLARIRRAIAAGRLVRRFVHGQPYWTEDA